MCGIVGLHLRNPDLYPRLGELLTGMLCEMGDRGSDSAGVAVYGDPVLSPPGRACVSAVAMSPDIDHMARRGRELAVLRRGDTCLITAATSPQTLLETMTNAYPSVVIAGFGVDMAVLKGIGHPRQLVQQWGLAAVSGWQGVGHTRMATESPVTPAGCHPFAVGPEQCLVHNGSFANHATIRRELRAAGVRFDSQNDTEVGARFVAKQLADGRDVETALKELCARFDGFYTLLVSDRDSFAVVRDAIACKPAVLAETDDWVAMASEYRALAGLPGVERATLWEPEPEVIYVWQK